MERLFLILSLVAMFALGWFGNQKHQTGTAYAAATSREYTVADVGGSNKSIQDLLNTQARQGWRLHSIIIGGGGAAAIFER